jgi:hypothetical protein
MNKIKLDKAKKLLSKGEKMDVICSDLEISQE